MTKTLIQKILRNKLFITLQGDFGTALTHWEKRVFGDEAMTGNHQELEVGGRTYRERKLISRWRMEDYPQYHNTTTDQHQDDPSGTARQRLVQRGLLPGEPRLQLGAGPGLRLPGDQLPPVLQGEGGPRALLRPALQHAQTAQVSTGCPVKLSALRFCYFLGFQSTYRRTSGHFSIAQEMRISKLTLLSFLCEKLI